ncbi:hypothetical protein [Helicobacter cappadocius]|uniref:Tetratricopeptide repeat protein n=1 Tax=Helicobacter cappadocius TaxID=3063998 RepID=A0AA90PH14_9HELI|nr:MULTISPECIES: hypothetical protein [unclassified Helicobacter]MDO7252365.1 hypothetical protein [Helicobacter sp. faydin-H75]MDP2538232.1 hypothetical protein [Helicobacter sp. faydin-H76]
MKDIAFIYRDPLFGITILIAIIAIVALADYSRNRNRSKKRSQSLINLAKSYEYSGLNDGVMEFLSLANNPIPTLMFLAQTYAKSGDNEQAIKIYLSMLEKTPESKDKIPILEALGATYFNAGFLQRAKNIFIEILKSYPRNSNALSYLMRTYESMGEYKKALEVLDCLDEVEFGSSDKDHFGDKNSQYLTSLEISENKVILDSKNYLYLMMLINDNFLSLAQKQYQIDLLFAKAPSLQKMILSYMKTYNLPMFWNYIIRLDCVDNFVDLLWSFSKDDIPMNILKDSQQVLDVYRAKGYVDDKKQCEIFELELLRLSHYNTHLKAGIDFEYRCHSCKSIFPFDSYRCPSCSELGMMDLILKPRKMKNNEIS